MSEEYHVDLREAYCNAIDFLIDIVYPDSDEEFQTFINDFEKKEDTLFANLKTKDELTYQKLYLRRRIFKEMNKMFWRTDYFQRRSFYIETAKPIEGRK